MSRARRPAPARWRARARPPRASAPALTVALAVLTARALAGAPTLVVTVASALTAVLAVGGAAGASAGCGQGEGPRGPGVRAVRPIDERLLAALGVAQGLQRQADVLEAQGDRSAARAKVGEVLAIDFPAGAPEREAVRLDAFGRLAELHLEDGDVAEAERTVAAGLRESTRPSYFRARLYHVRGRVHERLAADARARGDADAAAREARAALDWLERGIEENRVVLGMTPEELR
jgi:hypothetical protein